MQSAARPSTFLDRAGAWFAPVFDMDQRRLAALLSILLLAGGWSVIWSARSSYVVEGVVDSMIARHYPWDVTDKFDLRIRTDDGRWVNFIALHGSCPGSPGHFERCVKPEFPQGARIQVETNAFSDPTSCSGSGILPSEFRCAGRDRRRNARADRYVTRISVGGAPVLSGWSPNLGILAWYGLVLAATITLWRRQWRMSEIGAGTIIAYCLALSSCVFGPSAWLL